MDYLPTTPQWNSLKMNKITMVVYRIIILDGISEIKKHSKNLDELSNKYININRRDLIQKVTKLKGKLLIKTQHTK